MHKKYFIFVTLGIALLIFSILPITNYIADPSRVLHHDYHQRYLKFHPHKLVLKVVYLIDNKNKYDTLVYGSSRGGFVDVSLISKNAYNMSHGFGTVTNYLHSLKSLLKNDVKVKNVWIAINDFDIWKDHTPNLDRLIYHDSIIEDYPLYLHWLFRLIPESITVLKENRKLISTQEVTDTHARIVRARVQEKQVKGTKRDIPPATLGCTNIFRINQAVQEIKEIKELCKKHDINLTVFMYPTFYKTYLRYNQSKIEEFKRKLVNITDFHDFYDLGKISTNSDNWFEGSHFTPSIGDFMIKNIKENNFLVTQKNIESRIQKTDALLKTIKKLPIGDYSQYADNIHPQASNLIFNIKDKKYKYFKNNHFKLKYTNDRVEISVTDTDPLFILNQSSTKFKNVLLTFNIKSSEKTYLAIYYKTTKSAEYNEANTYKAIVNKGINEFKIIMPGEYLNNQIRVDFTNKIGDYTIKEFKIHASNNLIDTK